MKVQCSQLQFAVSQSEYDKIHDKEITVESISAQKIAGRITKAFENVPVPRIGESVSDSYWPRDFTEQRIVDICYDYSDDSCIVYLEPFFMVEGCAIHKELKRIAELHGWQFHRM